MLEQLRITNFQTHHKFKVNFDPAVTCIVGPNGSGKTAILRALRWVCTNQPGGDDFISWGAKGCTVKLIADGHTITRRRSPGGGVNEYLLDDAEFKAFGRGVPEPIENFLNLGPVCWQGQHDAPYWLSDTAGEVSRQLNAIVNLGIIDDTLAEVSRVMNKARTRREVAEENLTKAKKEHDELAWVPDFVTAVGAVEAKETDYTKKASVLAQAAFLLGNAQTLYTTLENATRANVVGLIMVRSGVKATETQKRAEVLDSLVEAAQHYAEIAKQRILSTRAIENALAKYQETSGKATSLRKLLCEAHQYAEVAGQQIPDTTPLEDAIAQYRDVGGQAALLQAIVIEARNKETELCQREGELKKAEMMMPTTCPTCGQSLSPTSISKRKHQ